MPVLTITLLGTLQNQVGLALDGKHDVEKQLHKAGEKSNISTAFSDNIVKKIHHVNPLVRTKHNKEPKHKLINDGPDAFNFKKNKIIDKLAEDIKTWFKEVEPNVNDNKYKLNFTGFSRGAVGCFRLANKIQAMVEKGEIKDKTGKKITLDQISGAFYLKDPVAGLSDKKD